MLITFFKQHIKGLSRPLAVPHPRLVACHCRVGAPAVGCPPEVANADVGQELMVGLAVNAVVVLCPSLRAVGGVGCTVYCCPCMMRN